MHLRLRSLSVVKSCFTFMNIVNTIGFGDFGWSRNKTLPIDPVFSNEVIDQNSDNHQLF